MFVKKLSIVVALLTVFTLAVAQQRVDIVSYAEGRVVIFGTVASDGTITGETLAAQDTLWTSVPIDVGESHYFNLFLDVTAADTSGVDSCGFNILYELSWNRDATSSTRFYWKVGNTAPVVLGTWTLGDSCNYGSHYIDFHYPRNLAMPPNSCVNIGLVGTAQNDTCTVIGRLFRSK